MSMAFVSIANSLASPFHHFPIPLPLPIHGSQLPPIFVTLCRFKEDKQQNEIVGNHAGFGYHRIVYLLSPLFFAWRVLVGNL